MSSTKPVIFDPNLFSLSKAAIDHFETKLNKKPKAVGVRFSVKENDGCSGYSYDMDYVSEDTGIDKKNEIFAELVAGIQRFGKSLDFWSRMDLKKKKAMSVPH